MTGVGHAGLRSLFRRGDPFTIAVVALAGLRVLVPLAALAASGHQVPGLPPYRYVALTGDATGYYAAARALLSAAAALPPPVLSALFLLVVATVAGGVVLWRRSPGNRWAAVAVPLLGVSVAASVVITQTSPPGAPVVGWSLVWSVPMLPFRASGALDPDVAFALGLLLSLVAVAVTTFAAAAIGVLATGRRSVGVAAAALWALWPFLPALVVGDRAWENGQWAVDVGLHLYTEPLSTVLVASAVAVLLRPGPTLSTSGAAGLLLGLATTVKLSNGLVAATLLLIVALRLGARHAGVYALCGLVSAPIVISYWPKGYVGQFDGAIAPVDRPFALDYVWEAWRDSLVFGPRMLLLLLPRAVVGAVASIQSWYVRAVVVTPIVVTAAFYSAYSFTAQHPRFLYATLPMLFALVAAGGVWLVDRVRRATGHAAPLHSRPGGS